MFRESERSSYMSQLDFPHKTCPFAQASAFVTDLYMGTSNTNASFGQAITGALGSASSNGVEYNLTELDRVTQGLAANGVTPYWAVTYAPTAFQPSKPLNTTANLAQCLGYEEFPGKYPCRPAGLSGKLAGFDDCWKCPPKVMMQNSSPVTVSP